MSTPRLADLPRVLGLVQAAAYGFTHEMQATRITHGQWRRMARGVVLTRPDQPTRRDWAQTGLILAGAGAAISGWDAARMYELVSGSPPDPLVLILTPTAMGRVVGQVRIRRTRRQFVRLPLGDDAHVVAPARAVADTALQSHSPRAVRAVVTASIQRGRCNPAELIHELSQCPRNHSAGLRTALADVMGGARSVAEAEAADRLVQARVPDFELNVPVLDAAGRQIYVVDMLWRELMVALEIDSREFHFSEHDWQQTMARHNALTAAGLTVLHYAPSVTRGRGWADEVAAILRNRAVALGLATPRPGGAPVRTARAVRPPVPLQLPLLGAA